MRGKKFATLVKYSYRATILGPRTLYRPVQTLCASAIKTFIVTHDKYNGVTIDLQQQTDPLTERQFDQLLSECLHQWRFEGRTAVWIKVPISQSKLIPEAAKHGFQFHHAEHSQSLLKLWLDERRPDLTPRFATHQIGVSGLVLREDTQQVLAVQDKNSQLFETDQRSRSLALMYKYIDNVLSINNPEFLNSIVRICPTELEIKDTTESANSASYPDLHFTTNTNGDTAVREVLEETGVHSEFQSILALRQQHQQPGAFGRSDIFIVCRLKPLTFDISYCVEEIKACKWIDIEDLQIQSKESSITYRLTKLALYGIQHGFHNVDIDAEEMKSLYKGLKYKLYHRPLPLEWTK